MANEVLGFLKTVLSGLLMWFIALATTYEDAIITLFVGFIFNIIIGIAVDVNINKKKFEMSKSLDALKLLIFYYMLIIFVHVAMGRQHHELANTIVIYITYIVSYFHLTNIFKNATCLFPNSKAVAFIYSFLSTEVFYRLKDFLGFKRFEHVKDKADEEREKSINKSINQKDKHNESY